MRLQLEGTNEITVDAEGADRIELFVDGALAADLDGNGRFELTHELGAGTHDVVVRAWAAGRQLAYRAGRLRAE